MHVFGWLSAKHVRIIALSALALAAALLATGCSGGVGGIGGPKYTAEELQKAWSAHPEAGKWDMEVRDVISQTKSTGDHDAAYTVFLTTFTNKAVPAFKMYGTVDVPNDDSMTFEERTKSFFDTITYNSNFSGVQDTETFMRFFAKEYPKEFFVRLMQETGSDGTSTWKVVSLDSAPVESTMAELPDSGIELTQDSQSKSWSAK
ncbi:MAG: hypothetical protein HY876_03360 [Coriobacteriales bacterium]|nr:hypothetical protein [Coriobacteriales bacterium]